MGSREEGRVIEVRLTEGEARALISADEPEATVGDYPYWLLERAQMNIERAMRGEDRLPYTDDARPPLPADAPRLAIRIHLPVGPDAP